MDQYRFTITSSSTFPNGSGVLLYITAGSDEDAVSTFNIAYPAFTDSSTYSYSYENIGSI